MNQKRKTIKRLEDMATQIKHDQSSSATAEKRVKVKMSFNKAIKKMGRTPPPK